MLKFQDKIHSWTTSLPHCLRAREHSAERIGVTIRSQLYIKLRIVTVLKSVLAVLSKSRFLTLSGHGKRWQFSQRQGA
jgi:hypothetical protein